MTIRIGTAGWTIPSRFAAGFPGEGAHLERYARRFDAAEINSSFHRPHRAATYERWAGSVPEGFRFAVKVPKEITHTRRLVDCAGPLAKFLGEIEGLGGRLGPLLVQLPPSLAFDAEVARGFFDLVRGGVPGLVACEPRHASWFGASADALLVDAAVARVAADPARVPEAAAPGGWPGLVYHRLHGSPRVYYSEYGTDRLAVLGRCLAAVEVESWCIFDNTASGAALGNAVELAAVMGSGR